MGRYTAHNDPLVDDVVETHLRRIVTAIRARTDPVSIVLRGSFARGEGSIVLRGRELLFLSDYELMVVSPRPRDREILWEVGRQLTAELGVETGLARLRPSRKKSDFAPNTIMRYEMQCAGLTLYGTPILDRTQTIDPRTIDGWSAIRLLLNRMAEALSGPSPRSEWDELRLITKTALACAEAILAIDGQYHFSYEERGHRFERLAALPNGMRPRVKELRELIRCATAFKLRPALDHYHAPISALWQQVKEACDASFRYVTGKYMGLEFAEYSQLPEVYKHGLLSHSKFRERYLPVFSPALSQNLFMSLRYLYDRHSIPLPAIAQMAYPAYQIVYSLVPLALLGHTSEDLYTARQWLTKVVPLEERRHNDEDEWRYVRSRTAQGWRDFCYGLWEVI